LRNEVGALEKESNQVPYFQKFILTPAQQDPSNSLSVEWGLPNYLDVPLAHVTVDHKVTAVLLPGATAAPSGETTQAPYQVTFSSNCRNSGKVSAQMAVSLGLRRQVASGSNVFGIRVTVEGCDPTTGQIPVEITVLSGL
jgi:hypothetical protein